MFESFFVDKFLKMLNILIIELFFYFPFNSIKYS